MKLQAVKGTHDRLPEQQALWNFVTLTTARVLESAGAGKLDTPIFEYAEIFERSVGESADLVVQKEMYTFTDRGERRLTLRPEFTAGVMRSFSEHGMHTRPSPVKLWSMGPIFRAENVQRGRYRQFHQINYECLGNDAPLVDAETIALSSMILTELGLKQYVVKLGSVGDPADRERYNEYLRSEFSKYAHELSAVSQERLKLNPMRLLDSKDAFDQELLAGMKKPLDMLAGDAREHLARVEQYLTDWGVNYELDPSIVRGLDYYRRTAFELHYAGIGAQSALGGGGRYDGLIAQLGGHDTPGIGWALGVERVLDALEQEGITPPAPAAQPVVYVFGLDDEAVHEAALLATKLRPHVTALFAYQARNPGRGLRDASRANATHALLRGESERAAGQWQMKDLTTGEQTMKTEVEIERMFAHNAL